MSHAAGFDSLSVNGNLADLTAKDEATEKGQPVQPQEASDP